MSKFHVTLSPNANDFLTAQSETVRQRSHCYRDSRQTGWTCSCAVTEQTFFFSLFWEMTVKESTNGHRDLPKAASVWTEASHASQTGVTIHVWLVSAVERSTNIVGHTWCSRVQTYAITVGFLCHTHIITVCVCGTGGGGDSDVRVDDENKDPCRSSDVWRGRLADDGVTSPWPLLRRLTSPIVFSDICRVCFRLVFAGCRSSSGGLHLSTKDKWRHIFKGKWF